MALYRVTVEDTRYTTFWVEAESEADAREDAEILGDEVRDHEWEDQDTDVSVYRPEKPPRPGERIWTGGPHGDWRTQT